MQKAHTKFYAVKRGRKTGIFTTWEECKTSTWHYQNALFKAFGNQQDAENWFHEFTPQVGQLGSCYVYTDGSHKKSHNYIGMGAYCMYQGVAYEFSASITAAHRSAYGIPLETEISNPTAELMAMVEILKKFQGCKLTVPLVFISDYIGVKSWMTGDWKAKEQHIIKVLEVAKEVTSSIKGVVNYEWIKGHSNNVGNDHADRLAGTPTDIDTFSDLVLSLTN